jgi:uncharacterized PurR-regulated membrane protein YhhQ (DUF165 family)
VIRRVLLAIVAIFALGAAIATVVVAAAFALYALLEGRLGRPGAAAVVALVFAVLAAIAALLAALQAKARRRSASEPSLTDRLGQMARDHPVLAAVGALAAGLITLKNPQVVANIVSAVLAARAVEKTGRNRR